MSSRFAQLSAALSLGLAAAEAPLVTVVPMQ
jgi:hypothetical protein